MQGNLEHFDDKMSESFMPIKKMAIYTIFEIN